ncbi:MAG: alpha/beta hydrolase [Pseudolysinimonas sp.]
MSTSPTVVLVHGAFADASGFGGTIRLLQAAGHTVVAVPNPLRSLSGDAESVRIRVAAIEGPVVLVGHSYGGAVITQAADTLDNVTGLVYLAAFGLDIGESCLSVQNGYPPPMLATEGRPTSYDAPGAPGGPDITIDRGTFHAVFCADSSAADAAVMAATQRPIAAAALAEPASAAAWKRLPSWFQIPDHDNAIPPAAMEFMADRMGASVERVAGGSHTAFIVHARATADLIGRALI